MTQWLETLEMDEYTEVFHRAGYKGNIDVENLKELNDKELRKMGILKMGNNKLKQVYIFGIQLYRSFFSIYSSC